ncbi:COG3893 Inactivated superfamily I helicase [Rhabdaerophilaceae bacterium]
MARARPNVWTIAPGLDFAETLARALWDGKLFPWPESREPLAMADVILYVPTRRAGHEFARAFAQLASPKPAIIPDIRPLAEPGDPLEQLMPDNDASRLTPVIEETRRSISAEERAYMLVPAIAAWQSRLVERQRIGKEGEASSVPAQGLAAKLALGRALGQLIDEMAIEGEPLARLATAEPADFDPSRFDDYWSMTREFLAVAARQWPQILEQHHAQDRIAQRLARIAAETKRLGREPGGRPVVVAGSTGSVKATAELMRAVARLDRGAVVLPGLDQDLDRDQAQGAWRLIGHDGSSLPTRFAHPQASLKRTVQVIGIGRDEVVPLGDMDARQKARNRFVSEALRPAETAHRWQETRSEVPLAEALAGIMVLETADEREEARAIALLMRETLEDPAAKVALVTADRDLARRVSMELQPLGITPFDSAGQPLSASPAGVFARLFLALAQEATSANALAFLRHPLCDLGMVSHERVRAIDALEIFVCRTARFDPALAWTERVAIALSRQPGARWPGGQVLSADERHAVACLAASMDDLCSPFRAGEAALTLGPSLERLKSTLCAAASSDMMTSPDGLGLVELLDTMVQYGGILRLMPSEFPALMAQAMSQVSLPVPHLEVARASILGFLEARLVEADRLIIGGLNEGSVPPATPGDPFLNRAMRLALGLQPAERRVGQSAHDITMLASHRDLVLTRAQRVGTSPGIPSRFLRRFAAFSGPEAWSEHVLAPGKEFLLALRGLDLPQSHRPIKPPDPVPAPPRLPERITITEFETLRRDPFAFYARRLLRLPVLERLDPPPDARQRGTVLHAILEAFSNKTVPENPEAAELMLGDLGANALRALAHEPEAFQFWASAFRAIVPGFVAFDAAARRAGRRILVESVADHRLALAGGEEIRLRGKADRIEMTPDGVMLIMDYKTGVPPSWKDVRAGIAPQLSLTGALALAGAFGERATRIESIAYLPIGGKQAVRPRRYPNKPPPLDELVETAWTQCIAMLNDFASGKTAYRARLVPKAALQHGDYDHLARTGEWGILAPPEDFEPAEDEE